MSVKIRRVELHRIDLQTRLPFRYGIATMTECPHVFVRVVVDCEGSPSTGTAADHLPPKWFTKDPAAELDDEVDDMLASIRAAAAAAIGLSAPTAFEVWQQLRERVGGDQPPLLTQFGISLVERGVIEAVCRAVGRPFHSALSQLGVCPAALHPVLQGADIGELLPRQPAGQIIARHTVGMGDPLESDEIPAAERRHDGLPETLEECIRSYGLKHFKLKLSGQIAADADRLQRVARVLERCGVRRPACSMDGNEQFQSFDEFREYWSELSRQSGIGSLLDGLLFVEQPFHRDVALNAQRLQGLIDWDERPPLIIDESDAGVDSLPTALELGYQGTSHKNCKGVFKSVANACLLAWHRRHYPAQRWILSGEDLANIGPVALLQDLAAAAALGVGSVERNGHHYFRGLSAFPAGVQRQVLEHHPDLYRATEQDWPTLAVSDGSLRTDSLNRAAFGVGFEVDLSEMPCVAVFD